MPPSIDGLDETDACGPTFTHSCSNYDVTNNYDPNEGIEYNVTITNPDENVPEGCKVTVIEESYDCAGEECEDFSSFVPPDITIQDGICNEELGYPLGQQITYPDNPCPPGYIYGYSLNGSDFTFDEIPYLNFEICVQLQCFCELDNTVKTQKSIIKCTKQDYCMGKETIYSPCQREVCYSDTPSNAGLPINPCQSPYEDRICDKIKIPIKFHYGEVEQPSLSQITELIDYSNIVFDNQDVPIELILIDNCNDSNSDQVRYILCNDVSNLSDFDIVNTYLNIYVLEGFNIDCDLPTGEAVGGKSDFPWGSFDGVLITGPNINLSENGCSGALCTGWQGSTFVHEMGHYLGLYHTFHNNNILDVTEPCNGDQIEDTVWDMDEDDFEGNLMDYTDIDNNLTIDPLALDIEPCQKAKMLDVLFECRNQFCDDRVNQYLINIDQQNIKICEGQDIGPGILTRGDCFSWYEYGTEDNPRGMLIQDQGNALTDIPTAAGIYEFFLQDNGFIYNPNCGIKVTVEVKATDSDFCQGGFTIVTGTDGFNIIDPCFCGNEENILNPDGTVDLFHNYFYISDAPIGEDLFLTNCTDIYGENGEPFTEGVVGVVGSDGSLTIPFWHPVGVAAICDFTIGDQTINYASDVCQQCQTEPIPTMGEWGLMCLGLLLSIFGVTAIKNQSEKIMTA